MKEPVARAPFLDKVRRARMQWEERVADVPRERLEEPGPAGGWTWKDLLAHIAWYEGQVADVLEARAFVGSDLWMRPLEERNRAIYEQNRDRPPDEVLHETEETGARILRLLQEVSEEDLNDPGRYPGMPPDWRPWEIIADNTYAHYEDHARVWFDASGG